MVFPVVIYRCETWTINKAGHQRIDALELWCWRRPLRFPWTARRSNQSNLRKSVLNFYWNGWCWSWNSKTLTTWCKELTYLKRPWCWERLKAGGEGDDRGWDGWMASPTWWTWVWVGSQSWWWTGKPGVLQSLGSQRVGHKWETELNSVYFLRYCTVRLKMFYFLCSFLCMYICIIHARSITNLWQYSTITAGCISWVPRLTLLDLQTNWSYDCTLRTGLDHVYTNYCPYFCIPLA